MRIGKLDRKLTIQRYTVPEGVEEDEYLQAPGTWQDLYTNIWAGKRDVRGNEGLDLDQVVATDTVVFTIHYKPVLATDRILYEGRLYNISALKEIGRREQLEMTAHGQDNAG